MGEGTDPTFTSGQSTPFLYFVIKHPVPTVHPPQPQNYETHELSTNNIAAFSAPETPKFS